MRIARSFERRLERLLEGGTGRVFSGRIHPSEMAGRIAREADLARWGHATGEATANKYVLTVNPRDIEDDPSGLERSLEQALYETTAEAGLRLEGPPAVEIIASEAVASGQFRCEPEVAPGPQTPWARLSSQEGTFVVEHNRALLGRSEESDVVIPFEEVSRRHAVVWREAGRYWIQDIGSSNGTRVDGAALDEEPARLVNGSTVTLAGHNFRFSEA